MKSDESGKPRRRFIVCSILQRLGNCQSVHSSRSRRSEYSDWGLTGERSNVRDHEATERLAEMLATIVSFSMVTVKTYEPES